MWSSAKLYWRPHNVDRPMLIDISVLEGRDNQKGRTTKYEGQPKRRDKQLWGTTKYEGQPNMKDNQIGVIIKKEGETKIHQNVTF